MRPAVSRSFILLCIATDHFTFPVVISFSFKIVRIFRYDLYDGVMVPPLRKATGCRLLGMATNCSRTQGVWTHLLLLLAVALFSEFLNVTYTGK